MKKHMLAVKTKGKGRNFLFKGYTRFSHTVPSLDLFWSAGHLVSHFPL